jgi:hypothetical protein
MPMALPPGGAVVVRPDRYVASVAHDVGELAAATAEIIDRLGATAATANTTSPTNTTNRSTS